MLLHHDIHTSSNPEASVIVFVHGLFGSLSNLGMLARAFYDSHTVIQIDVRNHGKSPHTEDMNYHAMAQDVLDTLDSLQIQQFSVAGHSMGGKIAMKIASLAPERLSKLAVLDMAPFAYTQNHHDQIFKALFAVQDAEPETRQQATEIMKQHLSEDMVVLFLMKSFTKGGWQFNLNAIYAHYQDILSWHEIQPWQTDTLFLKGGASPYISKPEHFEAIERQFPNAKICTIDQAGHWLHAEKTDQVLQALKNYL